VIETCFLSSIFQSQSLQKFNLDSRSNLSILVSQAFRLKVSRFTCLDSSY